MATFLFKCCVLAKKVNFVSTHEYLNLIPVKSLINENAMKNGKC